MKRHAPKNHPHAFSLVEVIFAMALMAVAVLGVAKLHTSQLSLASTQGERIKAYFLAQEGLGIMESVGKDEIANQCPSAECECELSLNGDEYSLSCNGDPEVLQGFQRFIHVSQGDLLNGAWKAESQVSWQDQGGNHMIRAKRIVFE